jgi:tetratricopeptide (TPR) repeat protein
MERPPSCVSASFALLLGACAAAPAVERAYDGRVVAGRFIGPDAYGAFLRGASAEANGDVAQALAAYGEAARIDPGGAEIWTRIGEVRCRADLRDAQADVSFTRALQRDVGYARAWAAKAKCAFARGDIAGARAAAEHAAALDPTADEANALLARSAAPAQSAETRAALLALTITAHDPVVAWDALATWSEARGDVALWARALQELVRVAPGRRENVARASEDLVGIGERWEARSVAAAAADADVRPLSGDRMLASRLAVDEAIARSDADAVTRRATRVRLPLDEAAGRALLGYKRSLARELASAMARADPEAVGAQWVLAASGGADVLAASHVSGTHGQVPAAAAFVAFAGALAHTMSAQDALAALEGLAHAPIVAGDDVVVRPAVELASRGAFSVSALPADGIVELAALRGTVPSEEILASDAHRLDPRHEYLALALAHPERQRAAELRARFATLGASDPVVAAAAALMQLAEGRATAATAKELLARDGGDPLLAATALRLADKVGDPILGRRAREVLSR